MVALLNKTLFIKGLTPEENRRVQDGRRAGGCACRDMQGLLHQHGKAKPAEHLLSPPSEGPNKNLLYFNFNIFLKLFFCPAKVRGSRSQPAVEEQRVVHSPTMRAAHSTGTAPTVRDRHSIWPMALTLFGSETISSSTGSALRCSFNLCIENTPNIRGPWLDCSSKEQTVIGGCLRLKCS